MVKYVYLFEEAAKADCDHRAMFGGKGANLAEMSKLGMPVPYGFIITTEACTAYYKAGKKISSDIQKQIFDNLVELEKKANKKLGDKDDPFLVSVRSGARASMPGMMDTILNLGLNDLAVEGLANKTQNPTYAYDCYRRFIQMYADVVMGTPKELFEKMITKVKEEKGVVLDSELEAEDLKELVKIFKKVYKDNQGEDFPQDPKKQLIGAIEAVFRSWDNPRAITYRRMNDIPSDWGTAVNIQTMVFGNKGETSGTGVAFTRNPSTGENKLFGEFLMNAQGEDVVAGIRTPNKIEVLKDINKDVYKQFIDIANKLEEHYRDMQDLEFTIEEGKLFMLQTRNGKRTAKAALKIAVDLVKEGKKTEEEALLTIDPKQLDALLHPTFSAKALKEAKPIAMGLPASPGAAFGAIAFTAEEAVERVAAGEKVILVRHETSPEDIEGMDIAEGILTARGGMTSHAAVVARGMGKCCVAGCAEAIIDEKKGTVKIGSKKFTKKSVISIDGTTGNIYEGEIETAPVKLSKDFNAIMGWANKYRRLKVRTNADTPKDVKQAISFGAEGIGLCRTEHMFFEKDRISAVREMIFAADEASRKKALAKLLPIQQKDFYEIFKVMGELPVTIRLLDPPLHEFLPHTDKEIKELAKEMGITNEALKAKITELAEVNPMLGHRGCRLCVTYPEIYEMQTEAIILAAIDYQKKCKKKVCPEIMIPLVGTDKELKYVKSVIQDKIDEVLKKANVKLDYLIGTMLEIPRAALTANKIAEHAEFFSFGTNDLTQMTFGFSRDDAAKFLDSYYSKKILESDPFARLDQEGVGELVKIAIEKSKQTRPDIKLGICGEHGGDPSTIEFCHNAGLGYASCSPFRVPIAILAAAQANIKNK